ncbi:hypothetical protein PACTADRAFT_37638, partial [Pachysolen tannophilus NRRL Y-2460]
DIFSTPISTDAPNSMFTQKAHPVSIPSGITGDDKGALGPVQTNNFFTNFLLGDGTDPVYLDPYVVWKDTSNSTVTLAISHQTASERTYAPGDSPVEYYSNAAGVNSLGLSASTFSSSTTLQADTLTKFSINVNLVNSDTEYMWCPLLQGIGFITGIYYNLTPQINTNVGISSVSGETSPKSGIDKYSIALTNGNTWLMYVVVPDGQSISFATSGSDTIIGSNSVNGCAIQLCFGNDSNYDTAAGCYPVSCDLTGSVSGTTGSYSFKYTTDGSSNGGTTLMWALPHHVDSFTSDMSSKKTSFTIDSLVSGTMTAYLTNEFDLEETDLPTSVSFDPYTTIPGKSADYTDDAKTSIKTAATSESGDDVSSASDTDSMYTSGKILDKYAYVLYVIYYILEDSSLAKTFSSTLQTAMNRFTENKQQYPLDYDTTWKGIVSSAGMSGDSSADYGNTYYNDHHFHYGYHVHAAAIIAKADKDLGGSWLADNKDWVTTLIRDVANPSSEDTYFPVFRNFDWFNGHSWAHGITAQADGKDEESSSEDYNFYYGMKMWANVVEDTDMEARANLILAIMKRSLNDYILYEDDNTIEPSNFIGNKVSGIIFQNKIDHTTYFGTELQYIQGIHMLPITPISSYIRSPTFVEQEWTEKLASIIDNVTDGWRGILMLNVALYDPETSYNFFNGSSFSTNYLDDGMSKTWSLAYGAGVGGAS